jgi:peroxiredoxin
MNIHSTLGASSPADTPPAALWRRQARRNRVVGLSQNRSLGWLFCLLSILLCPAVGSSQTVQGELFPEPLLRQAPPFHLQDLQGGYHHLQDYRGRVVIVNVWASWCLPCRQELPSMNRAWATLKPLGIAMLAVNLGEEPNAVSAFLADYPIEFPVLLDRRGDLVQRWQVRGLPTTFVLNVRGEVVYRAVGEQAWDDEILLRQLRALQPSAAEARAGAASR